MADEFKIDISVTEPTIDADLRIQQGIKNLVGRYAIKLEQEAIKDAVSIKSGVKYSNLPNQSSAPGETPAEQSGQLLQSIVAKFANEGLQVAVGPTVDYAVYLHEGKKEQPDTKRPIMEPALERLTMPFMEDIMTMIRRIGQ